MDKIPFIYFLYADTDGRKVYQADWPEQFIRDFDGKEITEIGGFYICGVPQKVCSMDDVFKICRG